MKNLLVEELSSIKDPRRGAGQRHELSFVLLIVIMSTMSGCFGYRAIEDFILRNKKDLIRYFKPKKGRLPSFSTVRRVMMNIDFENFTYTFYQWSKKYVSIEKGDWLSIDGKAIRGTFSKSDTCKQDFISLISVFSDKRGTILSSGKISQSKESEIPKVKTMIRLLDIEGVVFTIDALHCQKKL